MKLTFLVIWGCIISALVRPSQECTQCCGSCTRPKQPSCPSPPGKNEKNLRYFPDKPSHTCTAASSSSCKGKFYTSSKECVQCCRSFL
uniref:Pancreatic trypsin inhibitor n=1 Tax=Rhipicephalus appendiculatus TaxID=34631 RepID=A0A131YGK9_RHIAP